MRARTVRDLGALVRAARRDREMTQAGLAGLIGVSRDWVIRLEQGQPRLETQRVLDALSVLGLAVDVSDAPAPPTPDPFADLLGDV
ncbi:MAG: helix-turn-helix domain-containing protein [Streptosporangiaceae bacterium]